MKNIKKYIFLIISFIIISNFGFGQNNEIKIKFIGNCGLYMTDGDLNLYLEKSKQKKDLQKGKLLFTFAVDS